MSTPTPEGREALWAKFTGGEKLAYGCGCRDTRAALLAELRRGVEGLRREKPWPMFVTAADMAEAARTANNNVVDDILDLIRKAGAT